MIFLAAVKKCQIAEEFWSSRTLKEDLVEGADKTLGECIYKKSLQDYVNEAKAEKIKADDLMRNAIKKKEEEAKEKEPIEDAIMKKEESDDSASSVKEESDDSANDRMSWVSVQEEGAALDNNRST